MVAAAEASLKRLKTDRVDLYWVHMPDDATHSGEIVRGLDDLVQSGKVRDAALGRARLSRRRFRKGE
jgi:aryl-alcohol dehydrogenase-like predicted oxidoreductase